MHHEIERLVPFDGFREPDVHGFVGGTGERPEFAGVVFNQYSYYKGPYMGRLVLGLAFGRLGEALPAGRRP
jgi:hypothetical protein